MARKNTTARVAKSSSNTMWGGRYKLGPAEIMEKINASIGFDRRLYAQDIAGSLAHCDMLVARGILSAQDGRAIKRGLAKVELGVARGKQVHDKRQDLKKADAQREIRRAMTRKGS